MKHSRKIFLKVAIKNHEFFFQHFDHQLSYISLLISIVLNKLEKFQLSLNKFIMTNDHAQIADQTATVLFLSQVVRLFPAGC